MQFDIDRYRDHVRPVDVRDIDLDDFRRQPLDEATLRCLRYMHDIEHHTVPAVSGAVLAVDPASASIAPAFAPSTTAPTRPDTPLSHAA